MQNVLVTIILTVQMLSALAMIVLILVQHGKGADMGAAFGSGSSGSLFGASGSANFLSRTTAVLASVFFVCTLALAYFGNLRPVASTSVLESAASVAPVGVLSWPRHDGYDGSCCDDHDDLIFNFFVCQHVRLIQTSHELNHRASWTAGDTPTAHLACNVDFNANNSLIKTEQDLPSWRLHNIQLYKSEEVCVERISLLIGREGGKGEIFNFHAHTSIR